MNSSDLASNNAFSLVSPSPNLASSTVFSTVGSSPGGVTFTVLESLESSLIVSVASFGTSTSVKPSSI